jgi:hypothetical protein
MPSTANSVGWIAAMAVMIPVGCADARQVASTTDETEVPTTSAAACAHPTTRLVQDGDVEVVETLGDIGRLGGSVVVVEVATGGPIVGLDEDPAGGASFPNVFTRYSITVRQLVIWPDSVPTPTVGDEMTLDVKGGTLGCFTLEVMPETATFDPGGTYLVAAGAVGATQLVLWDDRYAMEVTDGMITDPGPIASLPAPMKALIGQSTAALPRR